MRSLGVALRELLENGPGPSKVINEMRPKL